MSHFIVHVPLEKEDVKIIKDEFHDYIDKVGAITIAVRSDTGVDASYKLRITYLTEPDKYRITGFTLYKNNRDGYDYEKDGRALTFDSLEEALNYISDYRGEK